MLNNRANPDCSEGIEPILIAYMCHQRGNFETPGAQQSITYFDYAANIIIVLFGSCIFFLFGMMDTCPSADCTLASQWSSKLSILMATLSRPS